MKRRVQGLHCADQSTAPNLPYGFFLVQVTGVLYRGHAFKPYYLIQFSIVEPHDISGTQVASQLYCTPNHLWKLNWFLRDFGYDPELLDKDEIDEKSVVGLRGVIKIGDVAVSGTYLLNLDGFAPASEWHELSRSCPPPDRPKELRP